MSGPVLLRMDGHVALVTLNRPESLNAVNHQLRTTLIDLLKKLNGDPEVRAIVLSGAGDRAFCAGQDLAEAASVATDGITPWLNEQAAMYQAVRDIDKPCVAALQGVAAGAGFQIALCADWRIATRDARIGQPEVKAGLASIVGSYLMTLHVGMTHNVQLSLSGDIISGQRAFEIGLVTELTDGDVVAAALDRAKELAKRPPNAVRLSKQRFRSITQAGFDEARDAGIQAQLECYANGEPQAAMSAFLSNRASKGNGA
jgi:enoyl-CoA hydratase